VSFENWLSIARATNERVFQNKLQMEKCLFLFQKWCKDGSWQILWQLLLIKFESLSDLSTIQLDVTHTSGKRGGQEVEYQGRKKFIISNMLILLDNNAILMNNKIIDKMTEIKKQDYCFVYCT
jgi:hypothetical protein